MYILGIDIGTSGVRGVVCDPSGSVIVDSRIAYDFFSRKDAFLEQSPKKWWEGVTQCLEDIVRKLAEKNDSAENISAIGVTSTSGTFVLVDRSGLPLHDAIMYHDRRVQPGKRQDAMERLFESTGYKVKYTFSLPKLIWMKEHFPEVFNRAYKVVPEGDFIIGQLTGDFDASDYTSLLKLGFDIRRKKWDAHMLKELGLSVDILPRGVAPGSEAGALLPELQKRFGFSRITRVYRGLVDNNAAFLASGASEFGDCYSNLGSVLAIKVLQRGLVRDPSGRLYSYPHPEAGYLFGGSSCSGVESLKHYVGDLTRVDLESALQATRRNLFAYPLAHEGETLPFVDSRFRSFEVGNPKGNPEKYSAGVKGLAFIERWIYDVFSEMGAQVGQTVYSSGGGTMSPSWSQLRADILGKTVVVPEYTGAALGVAILVASKEHSTRLRDAQIKMTGSAGIFEPRNRSYDTEYRRFKEETLRRVSS